MEATGVMMTKKRLTQILIVIEIILVVMMVVFL